MELEKNLEINMLINLYGKLLNEKQLETLKEYYFYNNSLSEIAEMQGTTRQAVSDLLNRVVKVLYEYERKLNLLQKQEKINASLVNIEKLSKTNEKVLKEVNKIKNILED